MTFCGIIKRNLKTSVCPLDAGHCIYQHRRTNECRFTNRDLEVDDYCVRVGQERPSDEQLEQQKEQLLELIRKKA